MNLEEDYFHTYGEKLGLFMAGADALKSLIESQESENITHRDKDYYAKVTRSALQNAASIAGLLLTTDCMVTDLPEKKDSCGCGGHGAGAGMDGMM